MAALSLLRSILTKGHPHTKPERFPGKCCTEQISIVAVRQMLTAPPPLFPLFTCKLPYRSGKSPNLCCRQFLGDPNWYKTADHSLHPQVSQGHANWTQSSRFASFSQSSYPGPNSSSHKSAEDTGPVFTQCYPPGLGCSQVAAPRSSRWARSRGWHHAREGSNLLNEGTDPQRQGRRAEQVHDGSHKWSPEAGQQVKPRSQVGKTRSGPARYLAGHKHIYSIAQARAKRQGVWAYKHLPNQNVSDEISASSSPHSSSGQSEGQNQTPRQEDMRSLLMDLGLWQLSPLQKEFLNFFLPK